jgi:endonuclease YncB( thermonuclease family)
MFRFTREVAREMTRLPLPAKFLIGLFIAIIFVVITQWERLTFEKPPAPPRPPAPAVTIAPPKPEQRKFDFPEAQLPDKSQAAAIEAALAKRMARVVITEPKVESNGSVIGNGQTIYLYGIKPFDSKKLCTRASGERWACGLHAYATFRNTIAKKELVCDPKKILQNAVSAVCHKGKIDVALILVRDGLVEIEDNVDDAEMVKAQAFAKSRKLGIWDR